MPVSFASFCFNAPAYLQSFINLRSLEFRFVTLWLAASYYTNPLFLTRKSFFIYAFSDLHPFFRNATRA